MASAHAQAPAHAPPVPLQAEDARLFEFSHPTHGALYAYLLEHPRNFYLYLDETTQEW
jgi:hypothetical protein